VGPRAGMDAVTKKSPPPHPYPAPAHSTHSLITSINYSGSFWKVEGISFRNK